MIGNLIIIIIIILAIIHICATTVIASFSIWIAKIIALAWIIGVYYFIERVKSVGFGIAIMLFIWRLVLFERSLMLHIQQFHRMESFYRLLPLLWPSLDQVISMMRLFIWIAHHGIIAWMLAFQIWAIW